MALDQVFQNAAAGLSTNEQLQKEIGASVISNVVSEFVTVITQIDTQLLNPTVNTTLGDAIHEVVSGATKYGLNPLQWYSQLVTIYSQPLFGYGLGNSNITYAIYKLSAIYVNLQKLKDRNAQIYRNIVGNVLAEILYYHYQSIGQNLSKQSIRANIDWFANGFNGGYMAALNSVQSTAILRTGDPLFAQFSFTLISTLDSVLTSIMQNLINTAYSKVQIPQVVTLILKELGQNGFYNNMFNYVFNIKINGYINQTLQQLQQQNPPAGQQPAPQPGSQQGQQANLLNTPPQQLVQVPQPHVIRPQNQRQNQQNNQQGRQTS